jgi:hypothetical protein
MLDPSPREIFATRVMLAASKGKRGMGASSFPDSDVGHVHRCSPCFAPLTDNPKGCLTDGD